MMIQEIRLALRALAKQPFYSIVVIAVLALAMGANTAVFAVARAVVFRPLPYPEANRLVQINAIEDGQRGRLSEAQFVFLQGQSKSFKSMALYQLWQATLTYRAESWTHPIAFVSPELFATLGVESAAGRFPRAEDTGRGAAEVVVLSHRIWTRDFQADPGIIGKTIILDRQPRVVIGITPAAFAFPSPETEIWLPVAASEGQTGSDKMVVARLAEGATTVSANAELDLLGSRFTERSVQNAGRRFQAVQLGKVASEQARPTVLLLWVAVGLVLVLAWANATHLTMARAAAKESDVWVRIALGATRARAIRGLIIEATLLLLAGGAAGLILAQWLFLAIDKLGQQTLRPLGALMTDPNVYVFVAFISLLLAFAFGLLLTLGPLAATSPASGNGLLGDSGTDSRVMRRHRISGRLAVIQVAVAVSLLIASGGTLQTLWRLTNVELGYKPDGVLAMWISLDGQVYGTDRQMLAFYTELLQRVEKVPDVEAAGISHNGLFTGAMTVSLHSRPGDVAGDVQTVEVEMRPVSSGFFRALQIPLLTGTYFDEPLPGTSTPARTVLIDETLSRRLWGDADPLGRHVSLTGWGDERQVVIVGVVSAVRDIGLDSDPRPTIYVPHTLIPSGSSALFVRTRADPFGVVGPLRAQISALDRFVAPAAVTTVNRMLSSELASPQLRALFLGGFGALSLVVAILGVYSVMSYITANRTREFGIRSALGASPDTIRTMVLRQALRLAALGAGIGALAGHLYTRVLSQAFGGEALDLPTNVLIVLIVLSVAVVACFIPALAAARRDPVSALRSE